MTTLFISDLHLDETRPDISRAFFEFLRDDASKAQALYILGDFFESWIGDDDRSTLIDEVSLALKALTDSGVALYIMHGNRDFLIGQQFCAAVGGQLLSDPSVIQINGEATLLMHGDSLCSDDQEYMQFRKMLRSPQWQQDALAKPLEERRAIAKHLRMMSSEANSNKAEDIMDVNLDDVSRAMQSHQCQRLIHGHTHRPQRHPMTIDGQPAERIVLGDWDRAVWVLRANNDGLKLEQHPFPNTSA
ncbi:MAG: UDP-2,3-diacylglucosamine diphosphatase [Zhongshania sp.]|uniref:UDP-2,3-diacylglucosamine diphosphatase n=1 Tax=Zhongshania sp. TaxID=1971902 RepID=UPI0026199645|nr:UDP-2,3-diacylglucosamine diphosphatase [Zhongshania sp.]MDF1691537.1 UDP-2,3-diacylglucosamine diphosphatase [Zhongshania sp.]